MPDAMALPCSYCGAKVGEWCVGGGMNICHDRNNDWIAAGRPKCIPAPSTPVATLPNPKTERIAFLERKREATKAGLLMKFEDADFHGVADAAMDLRDIESELKGLRF